MLLPGSLPYYGFTYNNWGANPAATPGATFTPGTSNGEGTYAALVTAASVTQDCYWMALRISDWASTGDRSALMDIGVDPAGGTSYTTVIDNVVCGNMPTVAVLPGKRFLFPLFVKSGSQIAIRFQVANATANTIRAQVKLYGQPSRPEAFPVGMFSETIGTITNSGGQSFTPGNAGDGGWQSLGTTAKAMWWWQLCTQVTNATVTAEYCYVDLAYGDASNKHIITRQMLGGTTAEFSSDIFTHNLSFVECYRPVPAGATLYVRGRANNAPDTGYNAVAVGIGG